MPQSAMPQSANPQAAPNLAAAAPRFQVIAPPRALADKVSYKQASTGTPDPVAAADRALAQLEQGFGEWLAEDAAQLAKAWQTLRAQPRDIEAFRAMHTLIHRIKGNAPILGNTAAGRIAEPLAALMERCPRIEVYGHIVGLGTQAIQLAIRDGLDENDKSISEVAESLSLIVGRWTERGQQKG